MPDSPRKAALFIIVSAASFTLMGVMVREAGALPVYEKIFFRNLITLLISGATVARDGRGLLDPLRSPYRRRLLLRSCFGLGGVFLYFTAIDHLTLADATMLNKLSPFFVFVLAAVFLREPMDRRTGLALVAAFSGAILVIKPTFDLSILPALGGAGSGLCAASAYTLLRSLKGREPAHRIVFVFSLVSTVVTLPLTALDFKMPGGGQWAALFGIGVFAAGGQFFLTWAYQSAPAAKVSVLNYSSVIFALAAGALFWGEVPDRWSLAGGAVILATALFIHRTRARSGIRSPAEATIAP